MKTRNGFVSNSSTTSFVIYGVPKPSMEKEREYFDLDVKYGQWDEIYIGLVISAEHEHSYYSGVDESRPLAEQRKECEQKLIALFGEKYVDDYLDTYSESWFNG